MLLFDYLLVHRSFNQTIRDETDAIDAEQKTINLGRLNDDFRDSLFGDAHGGILPKNVTPQMKFWGVISKANEKQHEVDFLGGLMGQFRNLKQYIFFTR